MPLQVAVPSNYALFKCTGDNSGHSLVPPRQVCLDSLKVFAVICMHAGAWDCFVSAVIEWKVQCHWIVYTKSFLYYMMDTSELVYIFIKVKMDLWAVS